MWPVEREFASPEFIRLGTSIACGELIRSGVTTFNDMYFYEDDVATATAQAGMRGVCGQSIFKFPTPDAASYEDAMEKAREYIIKWKGHPLIVASIAPHAPYTTTPEILRERSDLAKEFDIPLHIHLAETSFEVDNMRNENGMPVIPYVKKQGQLEDKVIAAHCVHIDNCIPEGMIVVWTNTLATGKIAGDNYSCNHWTAGGDQGATGQAGAFNSGWTEGCGVPCTTMAPLYCFEQ